MTKRKYKIQPIQNSKGVQHLRILAGNGEIVAGTEQFSKPGNAQRAAVHLKEAGEAGFDILPLVKLDAKGQPVKTAPTKKVVSRISGFDIAKAAPKKKPAAKKVAALLKKPVVKKAK